jgi:hypothetical protein
VLRGEEGGERNAERRGKRRDSRLARAREAEEQGDVAVVDADVGGRVEGELAELDGLEVVHDGEDALLHLAGVLCAEDDHLHALEVDLDGGGGAHALGEAVSGELAGVVDDKVGLAELGELVLGGADEHVVHEEGVVGAGTDDADLDAVLGIPAGEAVKDIDEVAGVEVVDRALAVDFEGVCVRWSREQNDRQEKLNGWELTLVHLNVDGAPPDLVLAAVFVDYALVFGAPACLFPGEIDEGAGGGDDGALVPDGVLVELGGGRVALEMDLLHVEAGF